MTIAVDLGRKATKQTKAKNSMLCDSSSSSSVKSAQLQAGGSDDSSITVKPVQPLSKRQKIGFKDQLLFNAGQKYCRMLPLEHSAIL